MVKLLFKRTKPNQTFFTFKFLCIFFLYTKMLTRCYTKKGLKKSFWKVSRSFWIRKKQKIVNMLMDDIEIFLKKRQTESVNIVANNVKTILKMKIKGYEKLF